VICTSYLKSGIEFGGVYILAFSTIGLIFGHLLTGFIYSFIGVVLGLFVCAILDFLDACYKVGTIKNKAEAARNESLENQVKYWRNSFYEIATRKNNSYPEPTEYLDDLICPYCGDADKQYKYFSPNWICCIQCSCCGRIRRGD